MKSSIGSLPTPSTYTRILFQLFPQQMGAILTGTGLTEDRVLREPTMTVEQELQVFRNVKAAVNRPDWALELGRQYSSRTHGPLYFAALSAPTLGDGLAVVGKFARIRAPNLNLQTRRSGDRLLLEIDTGLWPQEDLALPMMEIILQVIAAYVKAVVGLKRAGCAFLFASPPPPHVDLYARYFDAPCEFNMPAHAFALPADLAPLPCPLHDEQSYRSALVSCREALDALLGPDDVVTRVQHLLASHFDQVVTGIETATLPRLDDLADKLCVSRRTLIRQLTTKGTTYRQLLEEEQRDVACKLLDQARYSISDIGALLGYSDVANFDRAFRRLHGVSPSQYRQR